MFKGRVDSEILPDEHVLSHYIVIYRDLISDMASETKIKIHLILVTKYRRKVLVDRVMNRIIEIIKEEMSKRKCEVIAIQGDDQDHIHIMMQIRPTHSVSTLVQLIKQYTRYRIWREFPGHMRKTYWYKELLWSDGYFCSSTGDASSETVKRYIETQGD